MKIIKLTKADFKDKEYIGKIDLTKYEDYHVEIEENLGLVNFEKGIYVNGYIRAEAGTGIKSGGDIGAGTGIKSGGDIKAGGYIKAGWSIKSGRDIGAGGDIKAGVDIKAGGDIKRKEVNNENKK